MMSMSDGHIGMHRAWTFVNCDYELMSGQIVDVRINEVGPYDMIGGIVDESAE